MASATESGNFATQKPGQPCPCDALEPRPLASAHVGKQQISGRGYTPVGVVSVLCCMALTTPFRLQGVRLGRDRQAEHFGLGQRLAVRRLEAETVQHPGYVEPDGGLR